MANYIVLEIDLNDKWWDKWFVVAGLRIKFRVHVDLWGGHGKERILCKKTTTKSERLLV